MIIEYKLYRIVLVQIIYYVTIVGQVDATIFRYQHLDAGHIPVVCSPSRIYFLPKDVQWRRSVYEPYSLPEFNVSFN